MLLEPDQWLALDRWLIDRAALLQRQLLGHYQACNFHLVFQKLHRFCVVELGGFYLDLIKDRQYTNPANSRARRSGQSALYHLLEAFVRWLAPVLSFTAEELWSHLPGPREDSVFFSQWHPLPLLLEEVPGEGLDREFWDCLIKIRTAVNGVVEKHRQAGRVQSGLGTELTLYGRPELVAQLQRLGPELRFALLCSGVRLQAWQEQAGEATDLEGLRVAVEPSEHPKCVRCWHHCADVGSHSSHPLLCGRCVENLEEEGERRAFI